MFRNRNIHLKRIKDYYYKMAQDLLKDYYLTWGIKKPEPMIKKIKIKRKKKHGK